MSIIMENFYGKSHAYGYFLPPTLLIDADGFAFQAAAAVQTSIQWDDDIIASHADLNEAKEVFDYQISRFENAVADDWGHVPEVVLCFSCPSRRYFRHDIYPAYKGHRKAGTSPIVLADLKAWASAHWPTYTKPRLEADDVVGILATHPKLVPGDKIVVSMDKDLLQIPGQHLNKDGYVVNVTKAEATRFLAKQVLMGDTSDGYPGIPGIGSVKAEKILSEVPEGKPYIPAIRAAYERAGLTAEDMATQINVARILHSKHYDFRRKEPVLWQM